MTRPGPARPTSRLVAIVQLRVMRFGQDPSSALRAVAHALLVAGIVTTVILVFRDRLESTLLGRLVHHSVFAYLLWCSWAFGLTVAGRRLVSDRRSHAWEALASSGVEPRVVAVGEVVGATLELWLLLGASLPATLVGWLFNGIGLLEVALAWLFVLLNAAMCATVGLWLASRRAGFAQLAIWGSCAGTLGLLVVGFGGSALAGSTWPSVEVGWPVWLATAWLSVPYDGLAWMGLVWLPMVATAAALWLGIELVTANLTHPALNRGEGLQRWHLITALPLCSALFAPRLFLDAADAWLAYACTAAAVLAYGWLSLLIFAQTRNPTRARTQGRQSMTEDRSLRRCWLVSSLQFVLVALAGLLDSPMREHALDLFLTCLACVAFLYTQTALITYLYHYRNPRFVRWLFTLWSAFLVAIPSLLAVTLMIISSPGVSWVAAFVPGSALVTHALLEVDPTVPTLLASAGWLGMAAVLRRRSTGLSAPVRPK